MDFLPGLAGQIDQPGLDPGVQILGIGFWPRAVTEPTLNLLQRSVDVLTLSRRQNPRGFKGLGVRTLQLDLKRKQEPVVAKTRVDRRKRRIQGDILLPQRLHHRPPQKSGRSKSASSG